MQEISFHEAFSLLSARLTNAEIARKLGVSRQTVSGWHGMTRGPHKRHRDSFMALYQREICVKDIRQGIEKLLIKYEAHFPSHCFTIEWYDKDNQAWINGGCLPWLCFDSYFFWKNRRGQKWDDCGWSNEEDKELWNHMIEQDRVNELVGLALL